MALAREGSITPLRTSQWMGYGLRNVIGDESTRWKNVTLWIPEANEEITVPIMQCSTVYDVKCMLAEVSEQDRGKIDLITVKHKKRMRNSEEVATKVIVKGLKHFGRKVDDYPHPFVVIGAGHLGLRQALHWTRYNQDWLLFERKLKICGNAWNGIANRWSKLQSEGPHYHLTWDPYDGREQIMMPFSKYSFWPTRDEIMSHFHDVITQFNLWSSMRMGTQITDMEIVPPAPGQDWTSKIYKLKAVEVGSKFQKNQDATNDALDESKTAMDKETWYNFSCTTLYPGALAAPHRKTFPGEEVFGGQIGYGFNDEFDYALVHRQNVLVIGMGAFAVENIRTLMEHVCMKAFVVARHHNLLLPRMLSWYVNQSRMPPPAAIILQTMEPAYKLYGADPWSYFSVTATADRSSASIKQYTRWGIGDIFFLGMYYKKVEVVEGEVKRLKKRSAVINNGRVILELDHLVKVLGFDSDFSADRIMKTKIHIGFWPDADTRRWVCSDQSAIDASRFGGTAISPYAASCTMWPHHYFQYQTDAKRVVDMGLFAENKPKPELGSAAYHYDPRTAATVQVTYSSVTPGIMEYGGHNDKFKKESMWSVAPLEKFLEECMKDWHRYCDKFKEDGSEIEEPPYPYSVEYCYWMMKLEEEDSMKMGIRQGFLTHEMMEHHLRGVDEMHVGKCAIFNEKQRLRAEYEAKVAEAFEKGEELPPVYETYPSYGHLAPADQANYEQAQVANLSEGKRAFELYKASEAIKALAVAQSANKQIK